MAGNINIQIRQISSSTSEVTMGAHRVLVDRPNENGGTNLGPMGGELFLAAAGGCFMSNLLAAIKAREANVTGVQIEVIGVLGEVPVRFVSLELRVTAEGPDRELLQKLVEIADRGCIVMNTLRVTLAVKIALGAPV
jgi:putative redox protein